MKNLVSLRCLATPETARPPSHRFRRSASILCSLTCVLGLSAINGQAENTTKSSPDFAPIIISGPGLALDTWSTWPWSLEQSAGPSGSLQAVARSGTPSPHFNTSPLGFRVEGAGTLSFHWRVSTRQFDGILMLHVNGTSHSVISGETAWQKITLPLGEGLNEVTCSYRAAATSETFADAGFVTDVTWTPAAPPEQPVPRVWVAGKDLRLHESPDHSAEGDPVNSQVSQWSYGYAGSVASTDFIPFLPAAHTNAMGGRPTVQGWVDNATIAVNTGVEPAMIYSDGLDKFLPLYQDQLLLNRLSVAGASMPVVRWTAPETGSYKIGSAKWFDIGGHGGSAHVVVDGILVNGQRLPRTQVFGSVQDGDFIGYEWPAGGNIMMPSEVFYLEEGATIDFILSSNNSGAANHATFNAVIARVASVLTAPMPSAPDSTEIPTYAAGEAVSFAVSANHKYPIHSVQPLVNGKNHYESNDGSKVLLSADLVFPYVFNLSGLSEGPHLLSAVVTEDNGTVVTSDPVKILVEPGSSVPSPLFANSKNQLASASLSGSIYYCSQSGAWFDASTWNGQGVPGRYDTAVIPAGFQVDLQGNRLDIGNIDLSGSIISPKINGFLTPVFVYGNVVATGEMRGLGILIPLDGKLVNSGGKLLLNDTHLFNYGETTVGLNGGIQHSGNSQIQIFGRSNLLSTLGSNRPVVASFNIVDLKGGELYLGRGAHLLAAKLIGPDGGSLVGPDGGSLVGPDGGSLVGPDGGSLVGPDGGSLVGPDGGSLIGADGASLIGPDGGSLIGADGGSLIGPDGGSFVRNSGSALNSSGTGGSLSSLDVQEEPFLTLANGRLTGNLVIRGDVLNQGAVIMPGSSTGVFRITGDYTQQNNGTLVMEIGGTSINPLQFDKLEIGGTANLGGRLIVHTLDGYVPQPSDTFNPLTYNAFSGSFDFVTSQAQLTFGASGISTQLTGANPPPSQGSFASWKILHNLAGERAAPHANGDNDSLELIMEYALGRNPARPDGASAVRLGKVEFGGQWYQSLAFERPIGTDAPINANYFVERSTTLQSLDWAAGDVVYHGATEDPVSANETVIFRSSIPAYSLGREFLRLKIDVTEH